MKTPKEVALEAANRAWPGVWHASDHDPGQITLVGQFPVVAKYTQGTQSLVWTLSGCRNKQFCADLLHFLNGGSE